MSTGNGTARRDATEAWRASEQAGAPLSGRELGARYGRSASWGRAVIADARQTPPDGPVAPPDGRQTARWADTLVVLVVALVAAAASYGHMLEVALLAGEPVWLARAFPITVDGLAVAALRRGEAGRWWLALALAVSVAGNVLAQFPATAAAAGPVVAAWPPLALYGTHRLLHQAPPVTSS